MSLSEALTPLCRTQFDKHLCKLSKAANLFEIWIRCCSVNSISLNLLRKYLSTSSFCAAFLLTKNRSLRIATIRQRSVSKLAPLKDRTSSRPHPNVILSVTMWPIWLWVYISVKVQVHFECFGAGYGKLPSVATVERTFIRYFRFKNSRLSVLSGNWYSPLHSYERYFIFSVCFVSWNKWSTACKWPTGVSCMLCASLSTSSIVSVRMVPFPQFLSTFRALQKGPLQESHFLRAIGRNVPVLQHVVCVLKLPPEAFHWLPWLTPVSLSIYR